jgi:hypothetical protein
MKKILYVIPFLFLLIAALVWAIPPSPPSGDDTGIAEEDIDTSAEIFTIVTDEVGSGALVGATSPTFVTSVGLPNTITSAGTVTWTMVDNQNAAIAFRAEGANDILKLTTTDSGPGATVTGFFTSTGLITGDDVTANDALTGLSVTATGGNLKLGGNDSIYGLLDLYGAATGSDNGGYAKFYTAADHDGTINEYGIRVLRNDMIIGPDTNEDFIKITAGAALDVDGVVTATGFVGNITGDVTGNADTATTLSDYANMYVAAPTLGHLVKVGADNKLEDAGEQVTDNSTASHFLYKDSDGHVENATTTGSGTTMVLATSPAIATPAITQLEVYIDCNGSEDPYSYCTSANASTLTATQVSRTLINSYGRGEAQTVTLPAAATGYTFIAIVGTQHNSAWKIQRAGSDTITWSSGGTDTTGKTYFQETNQAVGSRVSCTTYKSAAAAWSWLCGSVTGTWVTD